MTVGVCLYTVNLIPAETLGQSGSIGSSGVSTGSGLDTQLQQCCRERKKNTMTIEKSEDRFTMLLPQKM